MILFKGTHFIVSSRRIVKILGYVVSLGNNAMAIAWWPFIFVNPKHLHSENLIRHETIHIRQQLELLIVGAWLLYIYEYFYALLIKKMTRRQSYYYTSLEQEAHRNAMDPHYLQHRKPYAVFRYIRDKTLIE